MPALWLNREQAARLVDSDRVLILNRPPVFEEPLRVVRFADSNGAIVYAITSQRDIDRLAANPGGIEKVAT